MSSKRQLLAIGVEPFEEGQEFKKREWPLHVTLVPWFREVHERKLLKSLNELAAKTKPIVVELGERALFGADQDIPVYTIEPHKDLHRLHLAVLYHIHEAGGILEDLNYVSYKYRPHITTRHDEDLAETYVLDNFALINNTDVSTRRVIETFSLKG